MSKLVEGEWAVYGPESDDDVKRPGIECIINEKPYSIIIFAGDNDHPEIGVQGYSIASPWEAAQRMADCCNAFQGVDNPAEVSVAKLLRVVDEKMEECESLRRALRECVGHLKGHTADEIAAEDTARRLLDYLEGDDE